MGKNLILRQDLQRIFKNHIKKIIWICFTIWFIFFLFNIFLSLSIKFNEVNNIITDKVWIYFYINDNWKSEDIYKRIINIKDELTTNGIKVNFSSKQDAFTFLENKIPAIYIDCNKKWQDDVMFFLFRKRIIKIYIFFEIYIKLRYTKNN
jgi:cell division protein FtsX